MTARSTAGARGGNSLPLALREVGLPGFDRANDAARLAEPYPLSPAAGRVFRSLIAILCPPAPAPASPELAAHVAAQSARLLRCMHPTVARGFAWGLLILDWLPLLLLRSTKRLHRLDRSAASRLVARWGSSRFPALRLLVSAVRGVVLSVYFDQREVHQALRYAPLPFFRERLALRARLLEPVPAAAE